jgi:hypothetical protein
MEAVILFGCCAFILAKEKSQRARLALDLLGINSYREPDAISVQPLAP